jgi:putative oxidoreductase
LHHVDAVCKKVAMKLSKLFTSLEPYVFAALRIVSGAMFSFHGVQKIFGVLAHGHTPAMWSQVWFGGIIELVAGTLIALGFYARCAAFIASGMMAVAYMQFHWRFAFAHGKWLPAINQGELAVVYCFLFLYIAAHGPGILSAKRSK